MTCTLTPACSMCLMNTPHRSSAQCITSLPETQVERKMCPSVRCGCPVDTVSSSMFTVCFSLWRHLDHHNNPVLVVGVADDGTLTFSCDVLNTVGIASIRKIRALLGIMGNVGCSFLMYVCSFLMLFYQPQSCACAAAIYHSPLSKMRKQKPCKYATAHIPNGTTAISN